MRSSSRPLAELVTVKTRSLPVARKDNEVLAGTLARSAFHLLEKAKDEPFGEQEQGTSTSSSNVGGTGLSSNRVYQRLSALLDSQI